MKISGARSSQFLSSLLYLLPLLDGDSTIEVTGAQPGDAPLLVSAPLIDQTLESLARIGLHAEATADKLHYRVAGGQRARAGELPVNGDWPSAAALMAAVAVGGGMSTLTGLRGDAQGERRAEDYLAAMGVGFSRPDGERLVVHSKGELKAAPFNGDLATDATLALAAAACFAQGTSRFEGIGNLRLKECDRITEPLEELAKLGVKSREGEDWFEIDGNPAGYAGGIEVDSRGDHRVAQWLAIVGMRCERGLTITRAEHISKSYPDFFEDMQRMGAKLTNIP